METPEGLRSPRPVRHLVCHQLRCQLHHLASGKAFPFLSVIFSSHWEAEFPKPWTWTPGKMWDDFGVTWTLGSDNTESQQRNDA